MLWSVANIFTVGVFHVPKIRFTISGWRLLIWLILADLVEIDGPLSQSNSPECVVMVMSRVCSHRNRPTTRRNRV